MNPVFLLAFGNALSVVAFGVHSASPSLPLALPALDDWLTLMLLLLGAILTEFFKPTTLRRNNQTFSPILIFFFAGVLLLPPLLFILLIVLAHAVEWATERWAKARSHQPWYLPPYSLGSLVIAGLVGGAVHAILDPAGVPTLEPNSLLAMAAAAATFIVLNRVILVVSGLLMVRPSIPTVDLWQPGQFLTDFAMACFGFAVAILWAQSPLFFFPALAQVLLVYWVLEIPQLRRQAHTDEKTGLWNARYFEAVFTAEMNRATRFGRPLAIIMADLDLMRDINNAYGHLAGDTVLSSIGHALRQTLREYDIAARFGGEEFAIILPETEPAKANAIAERMRQVIAGQMLPVATSRVPIQVTMSFGVGCYPQDGGTPSALMQHADAALYQAKVRGRNRVVAASELPEELLHERLLTRPSARQSRGRFVSGRGLDREPLPGREGPDVQVLPASPFFDSFLHMTTFASAWSAAAGFLIACVTLAVLVAIVSGQVLSSAPGGYFYPLKVAFEAGRLAAASSDYDRVQVDLEFSRTHVEEIGELLARGTPERIGELTQAYNHDVDEAIQLLDRANGQHEARGIELLSDTVATLSQNTKQLSAHLPSAPSEVKPLVEAAISVSLKDLAVAQKQLNAASSALLPSTAQLTPAATDTPAAQSGEGGTGSNSSPVETIEPAGATSTAQPAQTSAP